MTKIEASAAFHNYFGFPSSAFECALEMFEVIEAGVPIKNLEILAYFVAPGDKQWIFRIVPSATYYRWKKARKPLSSQIGQKVARIAMVVRTACETFSEVRMVRAFLTRPHPLLRGNSPIELAVNNDAGARAVTRILNAGAYAGCA